MNPTDTTTLSADVMPALLENRERFLAFLERRTGRRDVAEEILQDAFMRGLERGGALREGESVVAWFYRLLRNALVDRARRRGAEARALARAASEPEPEPEAPDAALHGAVCACVGEVITTLKPEYAAALASVEMGGRTVREFAEAAGVTPNNAAVRLHRAREALRERLVESCGACTEHGCLQCDCRRPRTGG